MQSEENERYGVRGFRTSVLLDQRNLETVLEEELTLPSSQC